MLRNRKSPEGAHKPSTDEARNEANPLSSAWVHPQNRERSQRVGSQAASGNNLGEKLEVLNKTEDTWLAGWWLAPTSRWICLFWGLGGGWAMYFSNSCRLWNCFWKKKEKSVAITTIEKPDYKIFYPLLIRCRGPHGNKYGMLRRRNFGLSVQGEKWNQWNYAGHIHRALILFISDKSGSCFFAWQMALASYVPSLG